MIQHQTLKRSNLYKHVNNANEKVKSKLLIGLTFCLHQYDEIDLDNQVFKGSLKFSLKNTKKELEKTLDNYYAKEKGELNYIQADNMNDGGIIIQNGLDVAFQLAEMDVEIVEKFQIAYYKLLNDFNLKIDQ